MPIDQVDREAAETILVKQEVRFHEDGTFRCYDDVCEAFAAHRIAAEQRAIAEERAAVLAWCERYANNPLDPAKGWSEEHAEWFEIGCVDTACAIKSGIEAGEHRKGEPTAQE